MKGKKEEQGRKEADEIIEKEARKVEKEKDKMLKNLEKEIATEQDEGITGKESGVSGKVVADTKDDDGDFEEKPETTETIETT